MACAATQQGNIQIIESDDNSDNSALEDEPETRRASSQNGNDVSSSSHSEEETFDTLQKDNENPTGVNGDVDSDPDPDETNHTDSDTACGAGWSEENKGRLEGKHSKDKFQFKTDEGLVVRMYTGSITHLSVDAIVNAASENLSNIGGVAKAIEDAAGYQLKRECQQYTRRNGSIPVTRNCVTDPGDLPCQKVIHAVGPCWHSISDKRTCLEHLARTVENILRTAEKERLSTIAMPPISSGIFAVPKQACASMYLKGIMDFSQTWRGRFPTEVHIVDIKSEILDTIKNTYQNLQASSRSLYIDVAAETRRAIKDAETSGGSRKPRGSKPSSRSDDLERLNCEMKGLRIHIYTGDLLELKNIDSIVSTEDPYVRGSGAVARAILGRAGEEYKRLHANLSVPSGHGLNEILLSDAGNLPFQKIFHVILKGFFKPQQPSKKELENIYTRVLAVLDKADTIAGIKPSRGQPPRSIALPVIGAGSLKKSYPTERVCAEFSKAVKYYASKSHKNLKDVHIVNINPEITGMIQKTFEGSRDHRRGSKRDQYSDPREDDTRGHLRNVPHFQDNAYDRKHFDGKKLRLVDVWRTKKPPERPDFEKFMTKVRQVGKEGSGMESSRDNAAADECIICMCEIDNPFELKVCKHVFCKCCIMEYFDRKLACPVCNTVYGEIYGDQPLDGKAEIYLDYASLPGHGGSETYIINYEIPDGRQTEEHPNPGKPYQGLKRQAYLPNNRAGQEVLLMLEKAFKQRLIFTVGSSKTNGKDDVITWNDIHHKTRRWGGSEKFGYPDPDYFDRVKDELSAKGISSG